MSVLKCIHIFLSKYQVIFRNMLTLLNTNIWISYIWMRNIQHSYCNAFFQNSLIICVLKTFSTMFSIQSYLICYIVKFVIRILFQICIVKSSEIMMWDPKNNIFLWQLMYALMWCYHFIMWFGYIFIACISRYMISLLCYLI